MDTAATAAEDGNGERFRVLVHAVRNVPTVTGSAPDEPADRAKRADGGKTTESTRRAAHQTTDERVHGLGEGRTEEDGRRKPRCAQRRLEQDAG